MKNLFDEIKAGLMVQAVDALVKTDKPPLQPFEEGIGTPKGLPYSEYVVKSLKDAEIAHNTLAAYHDRLKKVRDIENKATEMQKEVNQKILEFKQSEGLTTIKQEAEEYKQKLGESVEALTNQVGPVLLEADNMLLGIFEQIKEGKIKDEEKITLLLDKIKRFASSDVAGIIMKEFDDAVNAAQIANDKIIRRLVSFKAPKDIQKQVKEYHASKVQAGVWDTLKGFGEGLVNLLKGAWETVSDKVSTLISSVDDAKPMLDDIRETAIDAGLEV